MSVSVLAAFAATTGSVAGVLPLLQIARMVRTRSARGVSLGFLAGGVANSTAWSAYGVALRNPTVIVSSSLSLVTGSAMLAVAASYRRRERLAEPVEPEPAVVPAAPAIAAAAPAIAAAVPTIAPAAV